MYIQRILRNAVLAELLLFLMVANCAPSRPREDVGHLPGDPAPHHGSRSSKNKMGAGSSAILSGHQGKYRLSTACSGWAKHAGLINGELLRFLPGGGVDARGNPSDHDTDIRLVSVSSNPGAVWIYSQSRKRFLCFNNKAKLITKKNPPQHETLCQFYDTFAQNGQRRLTSVYHPKKQSRALTPPQLAIPMPFSSSSSHVARRPSHEHEIDLDAWHVAFGRSGEPLKGSAWKAPKWADCANIVLNNTSVRTSEHHAPVDTNDMRLIFDSVRARQPDNSKKPDNSKAPKANQLNNNNNNKPNKSSAKNPAKKGGKHGVPKAAEPTVAPKTGAHHGNKRGKVAKARTTTTTQAPLPGSEEVERRTNAVSFDSLLAETEQLLAQAAALPAAVAASIVPDDETPVVEYSDAAARPRSTFILLETGGWKEVEIGGQQQQQPESQQPAGQRDDISA